MKVMFRSTKMSSCFNVKDKIYLEYTKCPETTCIDDYVGEKARRITERIKDHSGRDHILHVLKHSVEKPHKNVNTIDLKIIDKNFHSNKRKQQIAEALWIKDQR